MLDNDNIQITEIVVGIKHKRNFSVLDNYGEIIDNIVDNPNFSKEYFKQASSEGFVKLIHNDETKNYIKLNQFELIYRHGIDDNMDVKTEYNNFLNRVNSEIIPIIINKYNVRDFDRIGIVYSFKFKNKIFYMNCLKNIINSNFDKVTSIRFSEKVPTNTGKLLSGKNDYINKLYSLAIDSKDIPIFSYDYQYYFNPVKSVFESCKFDRIYEQSLDELKKDIKKIVGENNETK